MPDLAYLPITDRAEVKAFLRKVPLAIDADRFARFVLGFPHAYLATTSPVEAVKHYSLIESLGARPVISSVAREGRLWKLCLVARDRSFLFSRIAGALSCYGMNIVTAEAFANANAQVLDTFGFADPSGEFDEDSRRRAFQVFLEDVVGGREDLEAAMGRRHETPEPPDEPLEVEWDDASHPVATRLVVRGPDRFGLLYLLSRCISEHGCSFELAHVETPGERVRDEFYLTGPEGKLSGETQRDLGDKLRRLGDVYRSLRHQSADGAGSG